MTGPGFIDSSDRLVDLRVTVQHLRDNSDGNIWGDFPWHICSREDQGAVRYWRVEG